MLKQNWTRRATGAALAWALFLLAALAGTTAAPLAAQPVPPGGDWSMVETPHFRVVFPPELESVARRAAFHGERAVGQSLSELPGFGVLPRERIQMVITDHMDLSNGTARAAPYPRIVIWARPPLDGPGAIPYDDWLELVVTHEVLHILHLELTGTPGRWARRVLGRAPVAWPFFPAFTLPSWAVEGVAVHGESHLTGGGRRHGTRFDALLRARVLEGKGERIDQVMGASPVFPGGERPYAWGGPFFDHLAETRGEEAVAAFFHRQATRLNPLRLNATASETLGAPLERLHADWLLELERRARAHEAAAGTRGVHPQLLTSGARFALYPTFRPGDGALTWAQSDGRREAAIFMGGDATALPRDAVALAPLTQVGPMAWGPNGALWWVQPDYVDRYRVRSDLWRLEPGGRPTPVTRGLRVAGAHVHPESGRIAAVLDRPGTHELVLLDAQGDRVATLAAADPGVQWAHPQWSPDGTQVAVIRWQIGGERAVVVLSVAEAEGGGVAVEPARVVTRGRAPLHGVAWSPDGAWVLWSSEATGTANLMAAPAPAGAPADAPAGAPAGTATPVRQLTDLVTAGVFPAVDPSGEWVVFSLLAADGWELARVPWRPEEAGPPLPLAPWFEGEAEAAFSADPPWPEGSRAPRPWSPWSTLLPRHWLPAAQGARTLGGARVLAPTLGLESWAADPLERHRWDLRVELPVSGPLRRWEGAASWRWAGLENPVLRGSVSQAWDALARVAAPEAESPPPGQPAPPPLYLATRDRGVGISAGFLRPRFRSSHQANLELQAFRQDLLVLEEGGEISTRGAAARPTRDLVQLSATLARSTARSYAFHPSSQEGSQLSLRLRARREVALADSLRGVAGRDASLGDAVLSLRSFHALHGLSGLPGAHRAGGAPLVLALRGAVGMAAGPGAGATTFRPGGGGGGGQGRLGATWDATPGAFAVRGFEVGSRGGDQAWGVGAELRLPLALVHRGVGVLPIHVDRLAATAWAEAAGASLRQGAGEALIPGAGVQPSGSTLASVGGEVGVVHSLFFQSPQLLRLGVAVPLRGEQLAAGGSRERPAPSVYLALGWSF